MSRALHVGGTRASDECRPHLVAGHRVERLRQHQQQVAGGADALPRRIDRALRQRRQRFVWARTCELRRSCFSTPACRFVLVTRPRRTPTPPRRRTLPYLIMMGCTGTPARNAPVLNCSSDVPLLVVPWRVVEGGREGGRGKA
jgi:hypothetical protein